MVKKKLSKEEELKQSVNLIIERNFAPIASALENQEITDIQIDRYDKILFNTNGELVETDLTFGSEDNLETALLLLSHTIDQNAFSFKFPILDAKMPDGSRIAATHKTVSPQGTSATIRLHRPFKYKMQDYINSGTITPESAKYLEDAVRVGKNILISGSTGSWKTSMINVLTDFIPENNRVLICEDTSEIMIKRKSVVSLEAPIRSGVDNEEDGKNTPVIALPELILHTFRRRPDAIIVGEIRTQEAAAAVYRALTSGHGGLLSSLHTNSCEGAFDILVGYAAGYFHSGDASYNVIKKQILDSIDIIIHLKKHDTDKNLRYIDEMVEVSLDGFKHIIEKH